MSDLLRTAIEPVPQLWIASANINGFVKYHWRERENLCAHVLSWMPAQLIGFQEFSVECIAPLQSARGDLNFELGDVMGDIHNAIAYDPHRFKVLNIKTFALSPTGKMEEAWDGSIRSFMVAELRDNVYKKDILFVNMHLDNESSLARLKGLELILEHIEQRPHLLPTIIVGDANVSVHSPDPIWKKVDMRAPYDMMIDSGFEDCVLAGNPQNKYRENTFHGFQGDKYTLGIHDQFGTWDPDWNFVSNEWQTIDSVRIKDTLGGINYSDHYFLQSLIRLK